MDKISEGTTPKADKSKEKQRSIFLLIGLYISTFILLALLFPKENDMLFIPVYYFVAITILQFSYVIYYKFPFKSWPVTLLIVFIILVALFSAFSIYLLGLAGAYQH